MSEEVHMTAESTLDLVREGGMRLVAVAWARLDEAQRLLAEGRFDLAQTRASEATMYIERLASAERYLGAYGKNVVLVRARDVTEGMTLPNIGIVERIENEPPPPSLVDVESRITVHLREGDDPLVCGGDTQLLAWVE